MFGDSGRSPGIVCLDVPCWGDLDWLGGVVLALLPVWLSSENGLKSEPQVMLLKTRVDSFQLELKVVCHCTSQGHLPCLECFGVDLLVKFV